MTTFAQLRKPVLGTLKPPRVVDLPPSAWADREDKPLAPVKIGIKLISETDIQVCKSRASRAVIEYAREGTERDRIEAYEDAIMVVAVEHATCTPDDATAPYFLMGEDEIRNRLTSDGVRRLYNELETLFVESNPSMPEIDEDGMANLIAMWGRGIWQDHIPRGDMLKVLRLLEFCRRNMGDAEEIAEASGVPIVDASAVAAATSAQVNPLQATLERRLQRQ